MLLYYKPIQKIHTVVDIPKRAGQIGRDSVHVYLFAERYLEQLMSKLKKSGIVKSIRGAAGGYILARPMEEISVGDILRALEGSLDPVDCPGLLEEGCKSADSCVTKYVWKRINDSINRTVDEIRLDQLVKGGLEDGKIDIS